MPSFDTPKPISVTAHVEVGSIRFTAVDGPRTVVDVRPRDAGRDQGVTTAERTEVTYASGALAVRPPQARAARPHWHRRRDSRTARRLTRRDDRSLGPGASTG